MRRFHRYKNLVAVLLLLTAVMCATRTTVAQPLSDQAHSLRLAPADAAFYSVNLRIKEQWDIVKASKAYARLMLIPIVQSAKLYVEYQLQESPEPTIASLREYVSSDEGKEVVALVKEMFADEVFAFGGGDAGQLFGLLMEMNSISQSAQFEALASQQEPDAIVKRRLMEWLEKHKAELALPDGVMGFRLRDPARAKKLLAGWEPRLKSLLAENAPEIAVRLKRESLGGRDFITLRLDGGMLPWDQIRAENEETPAAEFEQWKSLFGGKTLVVAIGVVDEFLIASVGDSTEHLEKLGQGASLTGHPTLARLAKHASQRVTAISFASGEFIKNVNSPERSLNNAADLAVGMLDQAPLTPEQRAKLGENIRGLAAALVKYFPQPGNLSAVALLTPRGYEVFQYNEGTMPSLDASQPIAVLDHVGGNPLLFVATHSRDSVEDYNLGIDWIKRVALDLEQIVQQHAPPEEWAKYQQYRERGLALLQRLDGANREQIIPSMKANEQALVLDVASKSERWFAPMPRSPQPLPMFELGMVSRVNDAELLKKGVAEYAAVINDGLALAQEIHPGEIPEIKLPAPEVRTTSGATIYSYPFPAEWGVDSQLTVNAGLTNEAVAVTTMPAFTEQLLRTRPLAIDTAIDLKRPAAMVVHFQFAKLIGAIRPWIDYGVGVATGSITPDGVTPDPDQQQAVMLQLGLIMPQVNQFVDLFTIFRSQTSITYREDNVWVSQMELHIKDLE